MTSLMLWGIWFAMALGAGCVVCPYIQRTYRTDWYDLSTRAPLHDLDWQEIGKVMDKDPLKNQRRCRWCRKRLCVDLAVFAIVLLCFLAGALLICDPDRWCAVSRRLNEFGMPTGLAALGGTAVAVFYNVRLTARANNRQVWINSVRRHIHALIASVPRGGETGAEYTGKRDMHLTMLELLINPGERVHRSLITIVRLMHGIHDNPLDRVVICELGLGTATGEQVPDNGENTREGPDELKVWATRLANVLLKREWEQVKHVR